VEEMFDGFVVNSSAVTVPDVALLVGENVAVGIVPVIVGLTVVVAADADDVVNIGVDVLTLAAGIAVAVVRVAGILAVSLTAG